MFKKMISACVGVTALLGVSCTDAHVSDTPDLSGAAATFESLKSNDIGLRVFLQDIPKGGDLHNHLFGAVYGESWIRWAEEDGMCLDKDALAIRFPSAQGCGNLTTVKQALGNNQVLRNELIDKFSLRDFVPYAGWSGHDQFFATFGVMAALPSRFGDMVAETANLAGEQHVSYLELMHTMELFETILPMVAALPMSGDAATDYKTLMDSEFGLELPNMVARARRDIDTAMARKDELLGCGTDTPKPGCDVVVRFLNQPVRTLPSSAVFAHMIFGWHLMAEDERFVGTTLVAPEDDFTALKYYGEHMRQIDYLYNTLGPRNVSLHAGELWLGLVHPKELRFHINDAVKIGHAKRIGHGTDIVFEADYKGLLKYMAEKDIMVEINLTSSDALLGVKASEHPFSVYRDAGVPISFSTDDEGVARIDLTHEYVRATQEFDLSYADIKRYTYNGLKYAFVDDQIKADMIKKLDVKFAEFESKF